MRVGGSDVFPRRAIPTAELYEHYPARRLRQGGGSMRTCPRGTLFFALTALIGACTDQRHPTVPSFSVGGAAACPIPANVVVTDEAGLAPGPAPAPPGGGIGLAALFRVTPGVAGATPNVTPTRGPPGTRIVVRPPSAGIWLFTA